MRIGAQSVLGRQQMIVSGHPSATLAGWSVLQDGGSFVDAAIAASAVLAVVQPQATTVGGDIFLLLHDANLNETIGVNGSGQAPSHATLERFSDGIDTRGPRASTVPGMVAAWEAIHRRWGRLPWARLFESAIEMADKGFPVSDYLATCILEHKSILKQDPGCREVFLPEGDPLRPGSLLSQKALGRTLARIVEEGSAGFYEGVVGGALCDSTKARGGLLEPIDLVRVAVDFVPPLEGTYRDATVRVMPPNSFGLILLLQLNELAELHRHSFAATESQRLVALVSAATAALRRGLPHIADIEAVTAAPHDLLTMPSAPAGQSTVEGAGARNASESSGGTSTLSVVDSDGNGLTAVQSIFHVFGSAFLDPATGVLLNNRMTGFSADSAHDNRLAPGKRPAHTLCPAFVFKGGALRYLLGTPGGPSQTITLAQVIDNMIVRGRNLKEAATLPRWSMDLGGNILIEEGIPESVAGDLARLGYRVTREDDAPFFGSVEAIEILDNRVLCSVADHRREAYGAGV